MSTDWTPISEIELYNEIQKTELDLNGELSNFWQLIRVTPSKWKEPNYGTEGNGFWVVAICGKYIVWYNDIEEGFNISTYSVYGEISQYHCNQDELSWTVERLFSLVKHGGNVIGTAGPPEPVKTANRI